MNWENICRAKAIGALLIFQHLISEIYLEQIQYFWDKEGDQIIDKEGTELSSDVFTVINKIIAFSNAWTSKSDWLALHDISKR